MGLNVDYSKNLTTMLSISLKRRLQLMFDRFFMFDQQCCQGETNNVAEDFFDPLVIS